MTLQILLDPPNTFPIRVDPIEAFSLKESPRAVHAKYNEIDAHITQVDLRYVSQADFITVWRPFNQGFQSIGCTTESVIASSAGKEVIVYSPEEDFLNWRKAKTSKSKPLEKTWPARIGLLATPQQFWEKVEETINRVSKRKR